MIENIVGTLPAGYVPYETLVLCSNKLSVQVPLMLKGVGAPLLVGKGENPRLWIAVTTTAPVRQFFYIVQDNSPLSPQVQVKSEGGTTTVSTGNNILCSVSQTGEREAVVSSLDLRPVGLAVHGNSDELWIGKSRMSHSQFIGAQVAVMIGTE
ncbi:hypothetical protein [Burkholderia multivorans]|uniref:hypothetical protein n=1 Tax=Burkholderia multivorans TaxID=87883 RepID=UPI0011B1F0D2|nr:hypothetical protein [Burkholderia multivorans]MBU9219605.1 hypothetical protein [Burkholderia multivorans]MBU9418518.1 hypothetical protein [Burkholderia multivorans]